MIWGTK